MKDRAREEAERIANDLMSQFVLEGLPDDLGYRIAIRPLIINVILQAEQRGREQMREEAAKVAEDCDIKDPVECGETVWEQIAKAIRNLTTQGVI